ncbi:hypothetical protein GCM10022226_16130 [Sphaerisporangium flaviroseum]|uniref:Uncharacterized protein n=1 Tax=Sphaerisporangium flaviroseum TaxID=509199 RepID=A0ABP7HN32_9ACTN
MDGRRGDSAVQVEGRRDANEGGKDGRGDRPELAPTHSPTPGFPPHTAPTSPHRLPPHRRRLKLLRVSWNATDSVTLGLRHSPMGAGHNLLEIVPAKNGGSISARSLAPTGWKPA